MLPFDQSTVETWNAYLASHHAFEVVVKDVAVYGVYLIPLIWLAWWFVTSKKQQPRLLSGLASGLLGWGVLNNIVKIFVHQARPIQSLPVQEFVFKRPDLSFPSDHAAFVFGIGFYFLLKKQLTPAWLILILALLVSLARIAVAVHYPSDIIGGFVIGLISALIIYWLDNFLDSTVWAWIINLARKFHLA